MTYREEIIGPCRLILGDCREVLPTLGKVDAVVTDPPYLDGDQSDILPRLLGIARRIVVTPGKLEAFNWIARHKPDWEYCWRGAQKTLGGRACLHIGWEPILSYGMPLIPLGTDDLNYPIEADVRRPHTGHPWAKPDALVLKLVKHWSRVGDIVLDPFMGSGTTGVACVKLGRRFTGIEIDERYFSIACKRIEAATKQPDLFIEQPKPAEQLNLLDAAE